MQAIYGGGTSTADWDIQPDTDELMRLFIELPGMLSADIEAGKYGNYVVPEPVPGKLPPAKSELHSFIFNQFHEGLHIGTIGDLLGFLK